MPPVTVELNFQAAERHTITQVRELT